MKAHRSYPKAVLVRSEPYRRAVAELPCWLCGAFGRSQAAHGDEGKGGMLKSCDLSCWPGCGAREGMPGCHALVGSTGQFTKQGRRELEQQAARETRELLVRMSEHDRALRKVLVNVGLVT